MNGVTSIGLAFVGLTGFAISWTAQDIVLRPSDSLPPAIAINEIVLRDDGTVIYDADILTNAVWQAWSGTVFSDAEKQAVHCKGGDLARYEGHFRYEDWDTDYMVGSSCVDGLEAGMPYFFTWTPVGPDFAPVRFEGVVESAE